VRLGDIVALARFEQQPDGIAERISGGVDFGAQPAPRSAQALGIRRPLAMRAPAACWWARTIVLSIISRSRSASVVSACGAVLPGSGRLAGQSRGILQKIKQFSVTGR